MGVRSLTFIVLLVIWFTPFVILGRGVCFYEIQMFLYQVETGFRL